MASQSAIKCSVITPERQVLNVSSTFVAFPAHDGEIGVLPGRAPLVCKLGTGILRAETDSEARQVYVEDGFAEILDNRVTILTEQALLPGEIDTEQVNQALREAQERKPGTIEDVQARSRDIHREHTKLKLAEST